jgi:hypothetical protein
VNHYDQNQMANSGEAVSLSDDGNTVAIGAVANDSGCQSFA